MAVQRLLTRPSSALWQASARSQAGMAPRLASCSQPCPGTGARFPSQLTL